jgi:hypothetical protein
MKILAIYDNGGKTFDRYTIVTDHKVSGKHQGRFTYDAISASENGLGCYHWCQCMRGSHLGKKVSLSELSKELQEKIKTTFRLEDLRHELRAEKISYGELAELQSLAKHIDPNDVELLEAAGIPEFES